MSFQQARNIEDVQDEYEPSRLEAALWRVEELERQFAECCKQRDELLAACEASLRAWDGYELTAALDIGLRRQMEAVIAKARGE